jgi:glycogen debranching enzyme
MAGGKLISILEGNTFVVSDERGDIDASPTDTQGLFSHDTRFLSRWLLTVNGLTPNVLSTDDLQYFSAQFFLVPSTASVYVNADLSIIRTRAVGNGFHEDLAILNLSPEPADVSIRIAARADFADVFAVKDRVTQSGQHYTRVEGGRLVLGYRRDRFVRETEISASAPETELAEGGLSFSVHIPPHGEWATGIDVVTAVVGLGEAHREPKYHSADEAARPDTGTFGAKSLEDWLAAAPRLACDWHPLERIYERSLIDLAALRFNPRIFPGKSLPAAGLPWFMTVFGRDSIFTSLQALPFVPELAESTLMYLAAWQGSHTDDFRDEQPGKIFHEVRFGEMAAFEERPHSPYYGAADATALYLILLEEYERWSGNTHLVAGLEAAARAALAWIDDFGDSNHDGYVDYQRRSETGLENQCWKDSGNSILFADGSPSRLPRATCELQGYVYDAKRRCARLARDVWHDLALAERLEREAAALKVRFNRDYWLPERQFFALALDGDGCKVDALTSNIGHLLWSGIADEDKAEACVRHLMSDALFSGWGVRTMASTEAGYNPIGYHIGTVWPFDNSIIAWGLARYGYRDEAARIALGILEAALYFHERLPEAFSGLPRARIRFPVEYPTSCSPQAWSTGAPLLLLRVLLGIEPIGSRLLVDPALPKKLGRLELLDIPGRWGRTDAFGRGRLNDLYAPARAWEMPARVPMPIAQATA